MNRHKLDIKLCFLPPAFGVNLISQKIYPKNDIRKRSNNAGLRAFFQPKSPQIIKAGGKTKRITMKIVIKMRHIKKTWQTYKPKSKDLIKPRLRNNNEQTEQTKQTILKLFL